MRASSRLLDFLLLLSFFVALRRRIVRLLLGSLSLSGELSDKLDEGEEDDDENESDEEDEAVSGSHDSDLARLLLRFGEGVALASTRSSVFGSKSTYSSSGRSAPPCTF